MSQGLKKAKCWTVMPRHLALEELPKQNSGCLGKGHPPECGRESHPNHQRPFLLWSLISTFCPQYWTSGQLAREASQVLRSVCPMNLLLERQCTWKHNLPSFSSTKALGAIYILPTHCLSQIPAATYFTGSLNTCTQLPARCWNATGSEVNSSILLFLKMISFVVHLTLLQKIKSISTR
jgi:hypothetical protein